MSALERTVAVRDKRFLLRVETSRDPEDYRIYEDLRNEIWDFPDDHLAGTRNMMCENVFHEGGSLFIGAFVEAHEQRALAPPAGGLHELARQGRLGRAGHTRDQRAAAAEQAPAQHRVEPLEAGRDALA